jgi:hypothetical protein
MFFSFCFDVRKNIRKCDWIAAYKTTTGAAWDTLRMASQALRACLDFLLQAVDQGLAAVEQLVENQAVDIKHHPAPESDAAGGRGGCQWWMDQMDCSW